MSILMLSAFMLLIITLFAGIAYIANHTVTELNEDVFPHTNLPHANKPSAYATIPTSTKR